MEELLLIIALVWLQFRISKYCRNLETVRTQKASTGIWVEAYLRDEARKPFRMLCLLTGTSLFLLAVLMRLVHDDAMPSLSSAGKVDLIVATLGFGYLLVYSAVFNTGAIYKNLSSGDFYAAPIMRTPTYPRLHLVAVGIILVACSITMAWWM